MEKNESKRDQNKAAKKAVFIDVAQRLFLQNGFELTSIEEVVKEAGITKRTLYQYFTSKEDLFFAVTLRGVRQLLAAYEEAMDKGDTALEKIRLGNRAHLLFYLENPGRFRLLNYQPASRQNCEESPHYQQIKILDGIRMQHFIKLMAQSAADGSINADLDRSQAIFFAFFAPFSLLYTVSTLNTWDQLQLDQKEFLEFSFDLMVDALKQPGSPANFHI